MALTKEDLQAIQGLLEPIIEQQKIHNTSILRLENSIMHELKLLNENLPDAMLRREKMLEAEKAIEEHEHRIFALEQAVSG